MTKSLYRIQAIFFKELVQLKRDKMTFGMVIMIPLVQLMLFGYAINTNIRHIPIAVVDQSQTAISRILVQTITATQVVNVTHQFHDVISAQQALEQAKVRAIFIIPPNVAQRLVRNRSTGFGSPTASEQSFTGKDASRPIAQWLVDGSDTMIASAIKGLRNMPLSDLLSNASNRMTPTFEVTLYYNPEQRTVVNTVPGLLGIVLTMTMIMFTSAAIVRERERGNMEMLITTPIRPIELMLGKIIPYIFIGLLQVFIILTLGYFVFNVPINGGLWPLFGVTFLFICASLTLGLVISTITTNQLQAMQLTVFVLLPSILLSGFMFPYDGMPEVAQNIAEILPATHYMRLIRGVILRDIGFADMTADVYWLAIFTIAGLTIASLRFKKNLD